MSRFDEAYETYEKQSNDPISRSKFYKLYVARRMSVNEILEKEEA